MMRKRSALFIALFAVLALLLAACGQSQPAAPTTSGLQGPIKVGVVTSLTGPLAATGQQTAAGVKQAAKEINDKGGIKGAKIEVLVEDDQSTPPGALNAFNKLFSQKVVAMWGPTFTPLFMAAAEPIKQNKIPVFSSATGPVLTMKANTDGWVFRLRTNDNEAGVIMADYVKSIKSQKPAMLYANNDYGKGGYEIVKKELEAAGVKFVAAEQFEQGTKDVSAQLGKIKQANPDYILVYSVPADSGLIAVQASQAGIDGKKIIGSPGFATPEFMALAKETAEGITSLIDSMAGQDEKSKPWTDAVKASNPNLPVSFVVSTNYDAAKILFGIIEKTGKTDGQSLRDGLYATKGYEGVSGKYTFDAEGNGLHQSIIAKWEKGKLAPIATIAR